MREVSALALLVLVLGVAMLRPTRRSGARVYFRERANGTRPECRALLDAWEAEGTHDVLVAPGGGLRTALTDSPYPTEATTLATTAHGRGAALDVWPLSFVPYVDGAWSNVPREVRAEFEAFHAFAAARGFDNGAGWRTEKLPNGDWPHVQLRDWRALPFPPPPGGYA